MRNLSIGSAVGYLVLAVFVVVSLLPLWMAFKTGISYPNDVFQSSAERTNTKRQRESIGRLLQVSSTRAAPTSPAS